MVTTVPYLSPQVVQAIEKKAQPSLWSQIFSTAVGNAIQSRLPQAPIVNANMARTSGSMLPLLLIGGVVLLAAVALMGGRRRG